MHVESKRQDRLLEALNNSASNELLVEASKIYALFACWGFNLGFQQFIYAYKRLLVTFNLP